MLPIVSGCSAESWKFGRNSVYERNSIAAKSIGTHTFVGRGILKGDAIPRHTRSPPRNRFLHAATTRTEHSIYSEINDRRGWCTLDIELHNHNRNFEPSASMRRTADPVNFRATGIRNENPREYHILAGRTRRWFGQSPNQTRYRHLYTRFSSIECGIRSLGLFSVVLRFSTVCFYVISTLFLRNFILGAVLTRKTKNKALFVE